MLLQPVRAAAPKRDGARPHRRGAAFRRRQDDGDARRARGVAPAQRSSCAPRRRDRTTSIRPSMLRSRARASVNLDTWAMSGRPARCAGRAGRRDADLVVIEGVMGLFDGATAAADGRRGATADLAAHFGLPVVLVLDVARQAQSAAAVVRGFAAHDPAVQHRWRHPEPRRRRTPPRRWSPTPSPRSAFPCSAPCPAMPALVAAGAASRPRAGARASRSARADRPSCRHRRAPYRPRRADRHTPGRSNSPRRRPTVAALPPPGQRIALASDRAFSFVYPHLLEAWRQAGAEILPFSPLADEPPPRGRRQLLAARRLPGTARRRPRRRAQISPPDLRRFAETRPVHGECGGYMVLGESLEDQAGRRHAMTGLLGHATSFAKRQAASRLSHRAAFVGLPSRPRRHGRARP